MRQIIILIFVIICVSCSNISNSSLKNNPTGILDMLDDNDSLKQDNVNNNSKNLDIQYPGKWISSSNFPKDNDFKILKDIITDSKKIDDMCDYFHAKKSKDFIKDKMMIVSCSPNQEKWHYYLINIDKLSINKINLKDGEITHPKIDKLTK